MPATAAEIRVISIDDVASRDDLVQRNRDERPVVGAVVSKATDWDVLRRCEALNATLTLGAFVGGELVGYSITLLVEQHPNYAEFAVGQNTVWFVDEAARGSGAGLALARRAAEMVGAWGRSRHKRTLMMVGAPEEHAALLSTLGYEAHEITFVKEV